MGLLGGEQPPRANEARRREQYQRHASQDQRETAKAPDRSREFLHLYGIGRLGGEGPGDREQEKIELFMTKPRAMMRCPF